MMSKLNVLKKSSKETSYGSRDQKAPPCTVFAISSQRSTVHLIFEKKSAFRLRCGEVRHLLDA